MKLKYGCPKCKVKSYSKHWNAETRKRYGKYDAEICEIQERENNSFHICPACQQESEMFRGNLIIGTTNTDSLLPFEPNDLEAME